MKGYNDEMRMIDSITHIGEGSLIQHGKHNNRIYLLKLLDKDAYTIPNELIRIAKEHNYSKIFCKIHKKVAPLFYAKGYILEGYIPRFYNGKKDAFFVSKFLDTNRFNINYDFSLKTLHQLLSEKPIIQPESIFKQVDYSFRKLNIDDISAIVDIYKEIFISYPFPIHDSSYIMKTMKENVQYFGAFYGECLVAVASAEIDNEAKNAEMTDFATLKAHSGHKLAYRILQLMEKEMKQQEILTVYTIARLDSVPMNKTFIQMKYEFSGILRNNTHISGGIETMVLYYKSL